MISKYLPLLLCTAVATGLGYSDYNDHAAQAREIAPVSVPAQAADPTAVPSLSQEEEYVEEVQEWIHSLPQNKQTRVRLLMREAHTELTDLRAAIREKKAELATLSFAKGTAPETLPRLGVELQALRRTLATRLAVLKQKLAEEASIDVGKIQNDAFWLPLPPEKALN